MILKEIIYFTHDNFRAQTGIYDFIGFGLNSTQESDSKVNQARSKNFIMNVRKAKLICLTKWKMLQQSFCTSLTTKRSGLVLSCSWICLNSNMCHWFSIFKFLSFSFSLFRKSRGRLRGQNVNRKVACWGSNRDARGKSGKKQKAKINFSGKWPYLSIHLTSVFSRVVNCAIVNIPFEAI